jgi:hypothetical protein
VGSEVVVLPFTHRSIHRLVVRDWCLHRVQRDGLEPET